MSKLGLGLHAENYWSFTARDKNGNLLWEEKVPNLVVDVGKDDLLTNYFKGSAYTAAFYLSLTAGSPVFASSDTMVSHSGWTEVVAYSEAARQAPVFGTASAGSMTSSAITFNINANSTTIGGGFICTDNTKGGTIGILYGGAAFSTGNKVLGSGDTLTITITVEV